MPIVESPVLVRAKLTLDIGFDVDEIPVGKILLCRCQVNLPRFHVEPFVIQIAVGQNLLDVWPITRIVPHPHTVRRDVAAQVRIAVKDFAPVNGVAVAHAHRAVRKLGFCLFDDAAD